MGRLSPVKMDIKDWGYDSPSYLRNRYLARGQGKEKPTYEGLILALQLQLEAKNDEPLYNNGIECVFNQTSLRRFEFLDAISYALEHGDLDERMVDVHPFENELRMFEERRNTVLHFKPDRRYQETICLEREAA